MNKPTLLLWIAFAALAAVIVGLTVPTWGLIYWDFGDGNYMYIARRVREGAMLYKDILAPQPPLHVLGGMIAGGVGQALGSELYGIRAYCLILRLAAGALMLLLAWRASGSRLVALCSAAIYLFLPIGFWWTKCYQSENLELVFLIAALWLLISWQPRQVALAGFFGALACHCNMTGVPFLAVNALFLACRRPGLLVPYLGAALPTYFLIAGAAEWWTSGYFSNNVLFNQVGTFPRTDILASAGDGTDNFARYAFRKITNEGWKVFELEGGWILIAFAAMAWRIGRAIGVTEDRESLHSTEFLVWSALGMLLSICFTAKGGTVNYIFVLGEPGIALFAGWGVGGGLKWLAESFHRAPRMFVLADTRRLLMPMLAALLLFFAILPGAFNIRQTLNGEQSELREDEVLLVQAFIETYTQPGDVILAPPFYAWLTKTRVAGELAENYIWQIKWMNESFDREEGEGVRKMREVAGMLQRREVKVVLLDLAQTGRVPEIAAAIAQEYELAEPEPISTRNTSIGLYVPKGTALTHVRLQR